MTTPTDADGGDINVEALSLHDPRHDERMRQLILAKMANLSPEELRMWLARKLGLPLSEVIVERPPGEDREKE